MEQNRAAKQFRNRSITGKFSAEEYSLILNRATSCGCNVSEYARRQLLESLGVNRDTRFVAAELLAFQETFLALILASLRGEDISDASLVQLRSRFDSIKYSLVERALQKANLAPTKGQGS